MSHSLGRPGDKGSPPVTSLHLTLLGASVMSNLSSRAHIWQITSLCILSLAAVTEFWVCFGPPWLGHNVIVVLTLVVSIPVYFIASQLTLSLHRTPSVLLLRSWSALTAVLLAVYLWLF